MRILAEDHVLWDQRPSPANVLTLVRCKLGDLPECNLFTSQRLACVTPVAVATSTAQSGLDLLGRYRLVEEVDV